MKAKLIQTFGRVGIAASWLILPLFAKQVGCDDMSLGAIGAVYGLAVLGASFVFGRLSDIKGRRVILQAGLAASTVAFGLQMFADDPLWLGAARALCGFCVGVYPPALIAYASESKQLLGKFTSFSSLGWLIGTFLAGVVLFLFEALGSSVWGMGPLKWVILLSSVNFAFSFALSLALPEADFKPQSVPFFPVAVFKRNAGIYVPFIIRHTAAQAVWIIFPLLLMERGVSIGYIGFVYAVNNGTQFVFMQFSDRMDTRKLFSAGMVLTCLVFVILMYADNLAWVMASQVTLGFAWGAMYSAAVQMLARDNPEKATAQGLLESAISLSMVLGPLIGGFVAHLYGYSGPLYVGAGGAVLALFLYWGIDHVARSKTKPPTAPIECGRLGTS